MKQIYLLILACSLLVLPSALSGQSQKDGSSPTGRVPSKNTETFMRCGTPQSTAYERPKGKCSCEIITGARVWGCTGKNQLDCEAQTCTYERLDLRTGDVIEKGNMECAWTPYYPS